MADEYSDDEFAQDDADQAYAAEFDADEHDEAAVYEDDHEHEVTPSEDAAAYQESYDAEFDPPDVDEPLATAAAPVPTMTEIPADPEITPTLEPNVDADEATRLLLQVPTDAVTADISSKGDGPFTAEHYPGRANVAAMEREGAFSNRSAPVRRSSEPRIKSVVPEIERYVDTDLQAKLIRRSSSPRVRPSPISRLHSVGELSAAAPDELGVPTNEITEEAAELIRRCSSPRMRPAPVARLPSVGEFSAVASDELEIPTNAITEEAAAIVNAAASDEVAQGLVKRHSSQSFVPRLASLRELDGDLAAKLEATGIGTRTGDTDEDEDDDSDNDDDGEEDIGVSADEYMRREDDFEDGAAVNGGTMDVARTSAGNYENESSSSGDANDLNEQQSRCENVETKQIDPPKERLCPPSNSPKCAAELLRNQLCDEPGVLHLHHFGSNETGGDDQKQTEAIVATSEGGNDHKIGDRPVSRGSQEESSARSSPLPLSEHLPDDDGETEEERLRNVLAEVEARGATEVGITEDLDGDAEYAMEADDDSGRETQQLLREAQDLITLQTVHHVAPNSPGDDDPVPDAIEAEAVERYGGDDQFSDDAYDEEDQELVDGAYYDSDQDEGIDEDQPSKTVLPVPYERNTVTPQPQDAEIKSIVTTSPGDNKPRAVMETPTKVSAEKVTQENPTLHGSSKKPAVPRQSSPQSPQSEYRKVHVGEVKARVFSQGSSRARTPSSNTKPTTPQKPDVPKLKPKAPVPRQNAPPPRSSHRIPAGSDVTASATAINSSETQTHGTNQLNPRTGSPSRESRVKPTSPTRSERGAERASWPSGGKDERPESPPRKAPVFKQPRPAKPVNPDACKKKLKPVKCPPYLRIDLPHVDKEKREWLLLNMFRHGEDIDKYEPFIPTATPEQTISSHLPCEILKRPLSARQIYGDAEQPPRRYSSRGAYKHHGGRKIVDPPVDPRIRERERNWISSTPSVSSIPQYDSILDKYCKTVTSPIVQRRIYETRMDDLSPQLAMVLEKRAFKEWKHSESEGFGAVSTSYKTAVVSTKSTNTSSTSALHTPRPPSSPSKLTPSAPQV